MLILLINYHAEWSSFLKCRRSEQVHLWRFIIWDLGHSGRHLQKQFPIKVQVLTQLNSSEDACKIMQAARTIIKLKMKFRWIFLTFLMRSTKNSKLMKTSSLFFKNWLNICSNSAIYMNFFNLIYQTFMP